MEKFIIVSANFCQSVFEKGFLQDVRHNLWRILRRDLVPLSFKDEMRVYIRLAMNDPTTQNIHDVVISLSSIYWYYWH